MEQQEIQGTITIRLALLIFLKDVAGPMVLYFDDNAQKVYDDLKGIIGSTEARMIEFEPAGPIKHAAILSTNIVGIALQEEKYLAQQQTQAQM